MPPFTPIYNLTESQILCYTGGMPTFAQWQASRGITPWPLVHAKKQITITARAMTRFGKVVAQSTHTFLDFTEVFK